MGNIMPSVSRRAEFINGFQHRTFIRAGMMFLTAFWVILCVTTLVLAVKSMSFRRKCPLSVGRFVHVSFVFIHMPASFVFFNIFLWTIPLGQHPPPMARTRVWRSLSAG